MYVSSLTVSNYQFPTTTTKKLTAEYLEPFEVTQVGGDTLTWDGDTSGLESIDAGEGAFLYRVSDSELPNISSGEVSGFGSCVVTMSGEQTEFEILAIEPDGKGGFGFLTEAGAIAVYSDGTSEMSKGFYLLAMDRENYVSSLTINGYTGFVTTEKKLKGEYVPGITKYITSSEGYLFVYGTDVTDDNNKVSKEMLLADISKGTVAVELAMGDGFTTLLFPINIIIETCGKLSFLYNGNNVYAYTSEYTP